jgi:hypothetical protein
MQNFCENNVTNYKEDTLNFHAIQEKKCEVAYK